MLLRAGSKCTSVLKHRRRRGLCTFKVESSGVLALIHLLTKSSGRNDWLQDLWDETFYETEGKNV